MAADRSRAGAAPESRRDYGIKVRFGRGARNPRRGALDIALKAANEVGMTLMSHIDFRRRYEEVVQKLRPGHVSPRVKPVPERQCVIRAGEGVARRARAGRESTSHGKGSFG